MNHNFPKGEGKITYKSNYWLGTPAQILKWSTAPCYNELMRQRQAAAIEWMSHRRGRRPNVEV